MNDVPVVRLLLETKRISPKKSISTNTFCSSVRNFATGISPNSTDMYEMGIVFIGGQRDVTFTITFAPSHDLKISDLEVTSLDRGGRIWLPFGVRHSFISNGASVKIRAVHLFRAKRTQEKYILPSDLISPMFLLCREPN
ncbi:11716_t:CDS:2 [Acaulospora colombiana]|uniref:11716_t:CDS:1 n=1 Tax=Acaulospora colombiana TaxID=27376 RepID=A0ACA9L9K0_9GLOM|nr:11716_t:CDS:2 [Acaulospora colombiana]